MTRSRDKGEAKRGLTRRQFIGSVGVGTLAGAGGLAIAASAAMAEAADAPDSVLAPGRMHPVRLRINGEERQVLVEPRWTLLFVLREKLGLTGAKEGCGRGECGACTVLIDGVPRYACLTLAVEAEGDEITTVEGLLAGEELGPVQQAFVEHDAFQCGYCTPGQVMAVEGMLRAKPDPSPDEIRAGMSGNLCRCGAYAHIFQAARRAASLKHGEGGSR